MRRWSMTSLGKAVAELTQCSIDVTSSFMPSDDLLDRWHYRCHELAQIMLAYGPDERKKAAQAVMSFAFPQSVPSDFWSGDLGQLLFRLGGFPPRNPTKKEAASILQVTHQAISYMIGHGRLVEVGGNVDMASLMERVRFPVVEQEKERA